ncbi:MAG: hypothetical protein WAL75_25960 [Terracidiphilus sp.]
MSLVRHLHFIHHKVPINHFPMQKMRMRPDFSVDAAFSDLACLWSFSGDSKPPTVGMLFPADSTPTKRSGKQFQTEKPERLRRCCPESRFGSSLPKVFYQPTGITGLVSN